jgi:AcrR family transcriptional regulator
MHRLPVTRARIGEVALGILDAAKDESALTMRALASALGVQAPSLYAHVAGIDDVLGLVHARINSSIDLSSLSDEDPIAGLRSFAHHYRNAYRRHLIAATIIITRSENEDHALVVYEPVAACLVRSGVPIARVMPCMAMLDNLALGSAIGPFAAAFTGRSTAYRRAYPSIAEALRASNRHHIDDEGFELGLAAFLEVVQRLSEPTGSSSRSHRG